MSTVSIITINYNNAKGLENTIRSVFSQKGKRAEYIIIDGNSTDGSLEVIKPYSGCIDHFVSEPDKGIYDAMNKGLRKATGDYLLFLNSGDVLLDDYVIERIMPVLESGVDIISGNAVNKDWIFRPPTAITDVYFLTGSLPHQGTFIRRELMMQLNGYNDKLRIIGDWDFFVRALFQGKASYLATNIYVSENEEYGLSAGVLNNKALKEEHYKLASKYFPHLIKYYPKSPSFFRKIRSKISHIIGS